MDSNWARLEDVSEVSNNKVDGFLRIRKLLTLQEILLRIGNSKPIPLTLGDAAADAAASGAHSSLAPSSAANTPTSIASALAAQEKKGASHVRSRSAPNTPAADAVGASSDNFGEESTLTPFFKMGDGDDEMIQALRVELEFQRHAQRGTIGTVVCSAQIGDISIDWFRSVYANLLEAVEGLIWCTSREKWEAALAEYESTTEDNPHKLVNDRLKKEAEAAKSDSLANLLSPRDGNAHGEVEGGTDW